MAWYRITDIGTGEVQYVTGLEGYVDEFEEAEPRYAVLELARCPEGIEEVDELGNIYRPVDRLQAELWERVKAIRSELEQGTAPTPLGRVQVDERSKAKLLGVALSARLADDMGVAFAESFTLADNTVVELDSTTAKQMALAAGQFVSAVYAHARGLRELIFADGVTVDDLDAIDLEAGWPS